MGPLLVTADDARASRGVRTDGFQLQWGRCWLQRMTRPQIEAVPQDVPRFNGAAVGYSG